MIELLSHFFPSYLIHRSSSFQKIQTISISSEHHLFFMECSFSDKNQDLLNILIEQLQNYYPKENFEASYIKTADQINQNHLLLKLSKNALSFQLALPLEFVNFLALSLKKTMLTHQSLSSLYKDLALFRPQFIGFQEWLAFSELELKHIFHHLLTQQIITPKMLAIFFFQEIISFNKSLFSTRIAQEIEVELAFLGEDDRKFCPLILFLMEINLISYFHTKTLPNLRVQQQSIDDITAFFLQENLPKLIFPKDFELKKQGTYAQVVATLKYSHPQNTENISVELSQQGQEKLHDDLTLSHDMRLCLPILQNLAKYKAREARPFKELVDLFLKEEKNWILLSTYCDFRDLLIVIEQYKEKSFFPSLPPIIAQLFRAYQEKDLIFPHIEKRTLIDAENHVITSLYFLESLGLIP